MFELLKDVEPYEFRELTGLDTVQVNRRISKCPHCGESFCTLYGEVREAVKYNSATKNSYPYRLLTKCQVGCIACGSRGPLAVRPETSLATDNRSNDTFAGQAIALWNARKI